VEENMKKQKLRLWWNTNGHNKYYKVNSVEEAEILFSDLSWKQLSDESIIFNAGGLEIFEDNEWCEYYNEDGLDLSDIMNENNHMTMRYCPSCSSWYGDKYPAISRKDNKTEICPACGVREAIGAYIKNGGK
jgi:hypothetical protein